MSTVDFCGRNRRLRNLRNKLILGTDAFQVVGNHAAAFASVRIALRQVAQVHFMWSIESRMDLDPYKLYF